MKFPYSMLLDFVETTLTADELGDLLTMAGFELEGIELVEDEPVLDIKVMSNRGDGLSILGLAREVLAKDWNSKPTVLYERASRYFDAPHPSSVLKTLVEIQTEDCTRFACRTYSGVINGQAPEWIRTRLRKTGQRSISLFVDLTNYVMLELGQPLHAYDLDKLEGRRIVVRKAESGEKLTTLDGKEHELQTDQMMICDAQKPVSAAGIMGGEDSEVSAGTKNVLLESAHFRSRSIRRTRKQLGLNTDASYRFERSVDPEGVVAAIIRFTELLGMPGSEEITDLYPGKVSRNPVAIRIDRASMLLGMSLKDEEAQQYLQRLGMEVAGHGDPFYVVPPSWRPDITREEDLVEELGRVHGYEKIPELLPKGTSTLGLVQGPLQQVDQLIGSTVRQGYVQIMAHTLWGKHPLDAEGDRIGPRVVSSPDYAFLRNSLLPGLAEAFQRNGGKNLHLFEIGKVFDLEEGEVIETRKLSTMVAGELMPSFRKGDNFPMADFYSLKGDLEAILGTVGKVMRFQAVVEADPRFHPTRQADVIVEGTFIGRAGQIHPEIARELKIDLQTYISEIDVDLLFCTPPSVLRMKPVSRNPSVRRDIALLIDKSVSFERIESQLMSAAGETLEKHWVFDDFDGAGIAEGKHSLGIAMTLRKVGENFTDQEANQVRDQVVAALATLGGIPR